MWFPYSAPFYVARIAEMRPALIVLATAITIGILLLESLLAQLS